MWWIGPGEESINRELHTQSLGLKDEKLDGLVSSFITCGFSSSPSLRPPTIRAMDYIM